VGEGKGERHRETTTGRRTSLASIVTAVVGARTSTIGLLETRLGTATLVATGGVGTLAVLAGVLMRTKDAILALKTTKKGLSKVGGLQKRVRIQNSIEKEPSFIRLKGLFNGQACRAGLFKVFQAITTLFGTALYLLF